MASLRMRTPAEYALMLWRRRYYILVPMFIVASTLAYVIYRLPNMYESTTLIIVDAVKVNPEIATGPTQVDITAQLGQIRNLVTSRTELKRIIEAYDLYADMRRVNTPEEIVLDEMQRHVNIGIKNTGSGANAFTISFRNQDREIAQAVTGELARRFINESVDKASRERREMINQLDNNVAEYRKRLEKTESDRADFFRKYPYAIEGNVQNLIAQLNNISMERSTKSSSISTLRSQIQTREQLLAALKSGDMEPQNAGRASNDSPTRAVLVSRLADAENELRRLLKIFTEKHPEVRDAKTKVEGFKDKIKEFDEQQNAEANAIENKKNGKRNPQIASLEIALAADKRELETQQQDLLQIEEKSRQLQETINSIPSLQTEATKINRDYETTKKEYDRLVEQLNNAERDSRIMSELGGYSFRTQDPANLPETAVAPKRMFLYPLSLATGLAIGLIIALARESRFLFTIRDARDVEHYMHLPLLVTVPQIITPQEQRQRITLRLVQIAGILLLIIVSIPVLITVIQKSRVMNIFTGAY